MLNFSKSLKFDTHENAVTHENFDLPLPNRNFNHLSIVFVHNETVLNSITDPEYRSSPKDYTHEQNKEYEENRARINFFKLKSKSELFNNFQKRFDEAGVKFGGEIQYLTIQADPTDRKNNKDFTWNLTFLEKCIYLDEVLINNDQDDYQELFWTKICRHLNLSQVTKLTIRNNKGGLSEEVINSIPVGIKDLILYVSEFREEEEKLLATKLETCIFIENFYLLSSNLYREDKPSDIFYAYKKNEQLHNLYSYKKDEPLHNKCTKFTEELTRRLVSLNNELNLRAYSRFSPTDKVVEESKPIEETKLVEKAKWPENIMTLYVFTNIQKLIKHNNVKEFRNFYKNNLKNITLETCKNNNLSDDVSTETQIIKKLLLNDLFKCKNASLVDFLIEIKSPIIIINSGFILEYLTKKLIFHTTACRNRSPTLLPKDEFDFYFSTYTKIFLGEKIPSEFLFSTDLLSPSIIIIKQLMCYNVRFNAHEEGFKMREYLLDCLIKNNPDFLNMQFNFLSKNPYQTPLMYSIHSYFSITGNVPDLVLFTRMLLPSINLIIKHPNMDFSLKDAAGDSIIKYLFKYKFCKEYFLNAIEQKHTSKAFNRAVCEVFEKSKTGNSQLQDDQENTEFKIFNKPSLDFLYESFNEKAFVFFKNLYSIPDSFACILQFLNKSDTTKVGIFFKKVKEWSIVRKEIYGTKLTHNDVKNITKQLCSKYKDDVDIFDYDTAFKFLKNYCTQLYKARQKCLDEENQPKNYLTLHKELMIVRKYKNYAKCQPQKYEIIYEDKMLMTKYQTIYKKILMRFKSFSKKHLKVYDTFTSILEFIDFSDYPKDKQNSDTDIRKKLLVTAIRFIIPKHLTILKNQARKIIEEKQCLNEIPDFIKAEKEKQLEESKQHINLKSLESQIVYNNIKEESEQIVDSNIKEESEQIVYNNIKEESEQIVDSNIKEESEQIVDSNIKEESEQIVERNVPIKRSFEMMLLGSYKKQLILEKVEVVGQTEAEMNISMLETIFSDLNKEELIKKLIVQSSECKTGQKDKQVEDQIRENNILEIMALENFDTLVEDNSEIQNVAQESNLFNQVD